MRKLVLLTALLMILGGMLTAQISNYYTFQASVGTYTPITGTDVPGVIGDDVISTPVDLGFTFVYGVTPYTQVKVSSNGYVTLGTAPGSTLGNSLVSTSYCPVVAPLWDDTDTAGGTVQYLLTGTAPNRIFTVQYTGLQWNYSSTTSFTYQAKLYETGKVEFIYGPTASTPTSASASIGINMLPGGVNNFYSITPGNPATSSTTVENSTIAIWPGNGTIYAFNPPVATPNDMAALAVNGNQTPSVGAASDYTITIRNFGTDAQNNYSVKLMSGTTELGSVAGPAIQPATNADVVIPWTPAATGQMTIYGKVVLNGDENPVNDQSSPFNVTVMPEGTTVVTIGTGNQTNYYSPVSMYYKNSLFETIYYANEINTGGLLTAISFYNNFTTNLPDKPTNIWLGITQQADLSSGWIPSSALTPVFSGNVNYPSGQNLITITLNTPFPYSGGNLVMLVQRPMDTNGYSTSDVFLNQTIGTNRARRVYSSTVTYDPAAPAAGTLTGQFPKTLLHFTETGPEALFAVSPESYNYGQVLMNQSRSQQFSVMNIGGAPMEISSIAIPDSPFFVMQNLPAFPQTLATGQSILFQTIYAPTAAGNHTGTINITDNLDRVLHTVPLTGNCLDPTIYTSPYAQAFDTVTIPNLPVDWQRISTGIGTITTVTTSPHSAPNCVYFYNSSDTNGPYLIAPPVSATLPMNTMRIKFWAKGSANYSISVGVMTDPTNTTTFTQVQSVTLTSAWAEYVVGFQTYTGAGQYITFKHGNGATYQAIYMDDVMIEVIPQNDVGAISLTGNTTPSVGMATNYTLNLFNWGTNPQTDYQVKLFTEGDVEVTSVAGPALQPGTAGTATLSWSPTAAGATFIYGKVVMTGDQNALNDQTPHLNVSVQAAGTMVVTIGEGDQTARMPLDMYYKNSLFETVFQATELNFIGMITGISFYSSFSTNLPAMPTKIWLGTTTQANLSGGWIPSGQLTSVFDGTVDYPSGVNTITITFPEPFLYLENNLVMMVNRPMDTQYYSSADVFYCQTWGSNRSLNVWSDGTTYDPSAPPAGTTATGQFPKTSLFVIPGGVGHLTGTVYGAGNQPLPNTTIQILNGAQTTTNAVGHYLIQNIIDGDYTVTASRYGYYDSTQNITIPEDSTVTLNFTLTQMPTVTVTGTIVGSDAPAIGLPGASITMTGYENYQATANTAGVFTIPGVYVNQTYEYMASAQGYQNLTGTVNVGTANQDMGNVILSEIAYSPRNVSATVATDEESINVGWLAPDPNAVDVTQGFETAIFPPTDWSRIVTDNGPPNTSGVYPTWCRLGEVTVSADVITPPEGSWQAGFWWSFSHQDEWLITPQFNCPQGASLSFESNVFLGSANGDHYYVKASADNGNTWTVLWDASAETGGWNHYDNLITIDLGGFTGQQIKLAWHADDPDASSDGMWYVWFIDDVVVANNETVLRFPETSMVMSSAVTVPVKTAPVLTLPLSRANDAISRDRVGQTRNTNVAPNRHQDRSLVGYRVYRLPQGQEQNEDVWTLLTPETITATTLVDNDWPTMPEGTYKWAVKGVYTNNVLSLAMFSNPVVREPIQMGTLAGLVRDAQLAPIVGATVRVEDWFTTTAANGSYILPLPAGMHSVTCTAAGYDSLTINNVVINVGQTTPLNFTLALTDIHESNIVATTALHSNYPNPFNPETTICFDVKDHTTVRIDIYNLKGQLIRTLLNESKTNGSYTAVWNGKDNRGNDVASGIYQYRMQAGKYQSTRRMMLLK